MNQYVIKQINQTKPSFLLTYFFSLLFKVDFNSDKE